MPLQNRLNRAGSIEKAGQREYAVEARKLRALVRAPSTRGSAPRRARRGFRTRLAAPRIPSRHREFAIPGLLNPSTLPASRSGQPREDSREGFDGSTRFFHFIITDLSVREKFLSRIVRCDFSEIDFLGKEQNMNIMSASKRKPHDEPAVGSNISARTARRRRAHLRQGRRGAGAGRARSRRRRRGRTPTLRGQTAARAGARLECGLWAAARGGRLSASSRPAPRRVSDRSRRSLSRRYRDRAAPPTGSDPFGARQACRIRRTGERRDRLGEPAARPGQTAGRRPVDDGGGNRRRARRRRQTRGACTLSGHYRPSSRRLPSGLLVPSKVRAPARRRRFSTGNRHATHRPGGRSAGRGGGEAASIEWAAARFYDSRRRLPSAQRGSRLGHCPGASRQFLGSHRRRR